MKTDKVTQIYHGIIRAANWPHVFWGHQVLWRLTTTFRLRRFWATQYLTIDNDILSYWPSVTVKINCCNVCGHFLLHVKYLPVVLLQVRVVRFDVQLSTCISWLSNVSYLLPFIFSNCHDVCDDKSVDSG